MPLRAALAALLALLAASAQAAPRAPKPSAEAIPSPALPRRIAVLALKQVDFGAISLIPVRFEKSRIAGPFEDGGRTLYCVTSHMKGRSFGKGERPKAVIRDEGGVLTIIRDEDEVCEGHRTEPFTEFDSAKA